MPKWIVVVEDREYEELEVVAESDDEAKDLVEAEHFGDIVDVYPAEAA